MSFEKLMGALNALSSNELLSKAQASDGSDETAAANVAAADNAAEGVDNGANATGESEGDAATQAGSEDAAADESGSEDESQDAQDDEGAGAGEENALVKSETVFDEDGNPREAIDVTELIKSMGDISGRISTQESQVQEALGKTLEVIGTHNVNIATLAKSFTEQSTLLTEQAALIKSLRADLDTLRSQGSGRKSVTNPAEVPANAHLVKSLNNDDKQGLTHKEFLTKCLALQKEGQLSMQDVAAADAAIGNNAPIPSAIVSKVFSSSK